MRERRKHLTEALITGPVGGGGGAFGKGASNSTESPDNLRSRQVARIVDLLGEGPNVGIVGFTKGIFYDGVPLQNADGTFNFTNASIQQVLGYPDQAVMTGFNYEESQGDMGSGVQLKYGIPAVRHILADTRDRVRFIFRVPSLQTIDDEGNIKGNSVQFAIDIQNNGGGYANRGTYTITGKTSSAYQREVILTLPAPGPWDLRVRRLTADSTSSKVINDLYWDTFMEITDLKVNYTNSHCVGTIIDAEQFGSIPSRTYLVDGRIIRVPNNYDPVTRTYAAGKWNGGFKNAWTNNPAWCLYDMVTHNRYGLGSFFATPVYGQDNYSGDLIDKWALYEIGKWCDELVLKPNSTAKEPRFVCNAVINSQSDAFDLLNQMTAIFRGFLYWSGGRMIAVADRPRIPTSAATAVPNVVGFFSPSNVIDGVFTYSGSDLRSRHNTVTARWLDGDNLGEERFAIAEDAPSITKYGIMGADIDVLGASTEGQALRSAKWMIYTDAYEGEVVQFSVGLEGAWVQPGDIIGIADPTIAGERRGGRVVTGNRNRVELDSTVTFKPNITYYLTCTTGAFVVGADDVAREDVKIETMRVTSKTDANGRSTLQLFNAFTFDPAPDTEWLLSSDDLMPSTWRVIGIAENDDGTYVVNAVSHNASKWDAIEKNLPLSKPDITNIKLVPDPVTGLSVVESLIELNVSSVGVVALISWTSPDAPYWDIDARPENGNWQRVRAVNTAYELQVSEGKWTFQVTPVSLLGRKGAMRSVTKTIIGRYAAPKKPEGFRVVIQNNIALFRWTPSKELDVRIGGHFELRHSPRTDGSAKWDNATPIIESIAGSASDCSAFYQPGTWFLRTYDIVGLASPDYATVVTLQSDQSYQPWARISEQPLWQGTKTRTVVEDHSGEKWLVLDYAGFGGLWDDQADLMDDWPVPAVDILPGGDPVKDGYYNFFNAINMGGVFTTRLTLDMLAIPYFPFDPNMDQRAGLVDSWLDWDNNGTDLDGYVRIEMRSTQVNPATATEANWTEWKLFTAGDQTGWGFQFRAYMAATPPQNIALQELNILADVSNKIDENKGPLAGGVTYTGANMPITFDVDFQSIPAITVTVQNAVAGDNVTLTNKSNLGFNITIKNGTTDAVGRKFDWHAMGY